MIPYDLHIHTEFCGHADGMSVEKLITAADEKGLETIAITDHVFAHDGLPVLTAIRAEVSRLKPKCKVIIGAEVDVDGRYDDGRLVTENLGAIDYVIAGFHYVPTVGNYPHTPDDLTMHPAKYIDIWQKSLMGIVSNTEIDTLAHPMRLLAQSVDLDVYFDDALVILREAAKLSAKNNIAWEINELTGWRLNGYYQQQWYRIFETALEHDVKVVYGSDAHSPDVVGMCQFAESILEKLPPGSLTTPKNLGLV